MSRKIISRTMGTSYIFGQLAYWNFRHPTSDSHTSHERKGFYLDSKQATMYFFSVVQALEYYIWLFSKFWFITWSLHVKRRAVKLRSIRAVFNVCYMKLFAVLIHFLNCCFRVILHILSAQKRYEKLGLENNFHSAPRTV